MNTPLDSMMQKILTNTKEEILWKMSLDCYVLKIISIPQTNFIWVIGSEGSLFLIESQTQSILHKFENLADTLFSVAYSRNTNEMILGTSNGVIKINTEGEMLYIIQNKKWYEHVCLSEDSQVLFVSEGKKLLVLEKQGLAYIIKSEWALPSTISDILFNKDAFLVSCYGEVRVFKLNQRESFETLEWKTSLLNTSWSPNKKYIACSTQENSIHFWPYPFKKHSNFQISGYQNKVTKMLWSNDSTEFIANCYEDVQIWNFKDGPPTGKKPNILECGLGKIIDIHYQNHVLIALSEMGFIFYFKPKTQKKFFQIQGLGEEPTCLEMNHSLNQIYIGTKSGQLFALETSQ